MKPAPFDYFRPESIEEALALLARYGDEAKLIAGGQSLVPMMNFRMARPGALIDINGITGLDTLQSDGGFLRIGPGVRHVTLRDSPLVRKACPLICDAYQYVAHDTVRNRGTLCGNLCHADPASEMPAVMMTLDASMVIRGSGRERKVSAADFFQGLYTTAVQPDEMLIEVNIPVTDEAAGHSFREVSIRRGDFALTLVSGLLGMSGQTISTIRLVYGGISDRAIRVEAVENSLLGQRPSKKLFAEAAERVAAEIDVTGDVHGSAEYRRDLIRTLTPLVLTQAHGRATGHSIDLN